MLAKEAEEETEIRAICPFCGSLTQSGRVNAKFYYNLTKGCYICFHCHESGGKLADEMVDSLQIVQEFRKEAFSQASLGLLTVNETAQAFTLERLKEAGLKHLGSRIFFSEAEDAIALPIFNFNQDVTGLKYRSLSQSADLRYRAEPGSQMEGYWIEGEDETKVLIVEGELDALAAEVAGFKGFILACQRNRLSESQLVYLKRFRNVFLMPDNDLGGLELENSVVSLLGPLKAKIVKLDEENVKDFDELLMKQGVEGAGQFLIKATQTTLEKETGNVDDNFKEMCAFFKDPLKTHGASTGWPQIDYLFGGGLRPNEMTVINAFAKTGKTSFVNNLIHNLAKGGKKVALASFEMNPATATYPSLLSIAGQLNLRQIAPEQFEETAKQVVEAAGYLRNVITLTRFGYCPWSDIEEWAHRMKRSHAIDFLVLDHAGFLTPSMTDAEENQILAKNIKKLTHTLDLHIPVVVQAPKTKDGLSIQTAYGGVAWAMNADNFLILERSKDKDEELKVKLEAARYPGANPSSTPAFLYYNRETCTLTQN